VKYRKKGNYKTASQSVGRLQKRKIETLFRHDDMVFWKPKLNQNWNWQWTLMAIWSTFTAVLVMFFEKE